MPCRAAQPGEGVPVKLLPTRYMLHVRELSTTTVHRETPYSILRARSVALRWGLVCCLRRRLSTSLVVYSSGFTCLRYNFLLSTIYSITTKYYLLTSSTLSLRRRYVVFYTAGSRLLYIEYIRCIPITTLRTANHPGEYTEKRLTVIK